MRKLWYAHYLPSRTNRRELLTESYVRAGAPYDAYDPLEALLGVAPILTPRIQFWLASCDGSDGHGAFAPLICSCAQTRCSVHFPDS
jgi:hypothetical protein